MSVGVSSSLTLLAGCAEGSAYWAAEVPLSVMGGVAVYCGGGAAWEPCDMSSLLTIDDMPLFSKSGVRNSMTAIIFHDQE